MATITSLYTRWILDSRGYPTITCTVELDHNGRKFQGSGSVPSGASTGSHEALELRDGDSEFHGKGVQKAIYNIKNTIEPRLIGKEFASAIDVDSFILSLDTSTNKSMLGANAILAVSMAAHRSFAALSGLLLWQYLRRLYFSNLTFTPQFPRLMCNLINGGEHADNALTIQEFMVVPHTGSLESDVQCSSEIYHTLKHHLTANNLSTTLGDEGGFAPQFDSLQPTKQAINYLESAINSSGYDKRCDLAMDVAATEFFNKETELYTLDGKSFSRAALADLYGTLVDTHPIISIEDAFAEDDVLGWEIITESLGQKISLVGDDLFVTNPQRFKSIGVAHKVANSVLIKLNQIGSVKETCEMLNLAKEHDYSTIVSHRSGETADTFISDLAFASQSEFIKLGAPARGERTAKYNRLLTILDSL